MNLERREVAIVIAGHGIPAKDYPTIRERRFT